MKSFVLGLLIFCSGLAQAQAPQIIDTGAKCYFVWPAKAIPAPGLVDRMLLSPNGKTVAVMWTEPNPKDIVPALQSHVPVPMVRGVGIYSVDSSRFTVIGRYTMPQEQVSIAGFLPKSNQLVIETIRESQGTWTGEVSMISQGGQRSTIYSVKCPQPFGVGQVRVANSWDGVGIPWGDSEPNSSLIAYLYIPGRGLLNMKSIVQPKEQALGLYDRENTCLIYRSGVEHEKGQVLILDLNTGARTPVSKVPPVPAVPNTPPFEQNTEAIGLSQSAFTLVTTAKPAPKMNKAVLGFGDESSFEISSDLLTAAWTCQNAAFVTRLIEVPRKLLEESMLAAEKTRAISDAKQAALAFIICASDYDDNLQLNGDWRATMMPYIKNADILSRFQLTYSGEPNMSAIKDPTNTELGYVQGPGGRAVAYVDGHVKWIPDK